MKTRLIFAAMLLMAFGSARAQDNSTVNTIIVQTTGDVTITQEDKFSVYWDANDNGGYDLKDNAVILSGTADYMVKVQDLKALKVVSTGDVSSRGLLQGDNLRIDVIGTGDVKLHLDYDNVYTRIAGTGDLLLSGKCSAMFSELSGMGDVDAKGLNVVLGLANVYSKGKVRMGRNVKYIAYHTEGLAKPGSVTDEGWCQSCSQGSRVEFVKTESGEWKLNYCDPQNVEVREVLQSAAPYFAEQSQIIWVDPENGSTQTAYDSESLSELMRELGENLQQLSDSVDWEQFERDMENWGAEMEEWGRKMEKWGDYFERKYGDGREFPFDYCHEWKGPKPGEPKPQRPEKKSLLLDAHWNGFEAGLNMLFNTSTVSNGAQGLDIRPLRSWYFGFNIADVGIAFDRRHIAGLFTGIGLGWNNFSWNKDFTVEFDPENAVYTIVPIVTDQIVKNSKYGVLFLQAPLMFEIRPTRGMYIDAGVTVGLRVAQWNRVKLADGSQTKRYYSASCNQFKLDASFRIGGNNLGFFANYALLSVFDMDNAKVHPLSFGFSINF